MLFPTLWRIAFSKNPIYTTPIMAKKLQVGTWLPQRVSVSATMSKDSPGSLYQEIHTQLKTHLSTLDVVVYDDLDFRKAVIKNHQVFIDDFCLSDLDHFVWFGNIDRAADSYHLEVLRVLEFSTQVHNSYTFYNTARDKFSAFSQLHYHGIPVSDIHLVHQDNVQVLEPLFEEGASFLLKPRTGAWGIGIIKVDQYSQLRDIIEYHQQKSFYIERFYPNDLKDWIGVSVVNGTVIYGFRKNQEKISGWKVYDQKRTGGKATYVHPPKEVEEIALKISDHLGGNFFGLDFIKTAQGYKVVDINCHPGLYVDLIEERQVPIAELFFAMLPIHQPTTI